MLWVVIHEGNRNKAPMATDYLSALNVGSGLNTTEIIDALVNAERAPREKIITDGKEERSVSISALGQVKTELSGFNTSLGVIKSVSGLAPVQPQSAARLEITDASKAGAFSHQLEVQSLATAQTLVFDGFTSTSQALGAGSLTISFGTWSGGSFTADANASDATITIADGADSLGDIRNAINAADIGVTASLITTSAGNVSLMLKSATGADKALRIVAAETVGGSGLAGLDYSAHDNTVEVTAASDASLTLDGVAVTRPTNTIDDLFDGMELTLLQTTSGAETLGADWDSATALAAMNVLVEQINTLNSTLADLSRRGTDGAENGPLAGDPLVRGIKSRMRAITTEPIAGYGDDPIYLANFGLKTERDGSITLDEATFAETFRNDPASFNAIIKDKISSSQSGVKATVASDNWTAGAYTFEIDGDGNATIDGDAMTLLNGVYRINDGNADGLRLEIPIGMSNATIYMGRSLVSQLETYAETMLARNNDIDNQIDRYNDDISYYDEKLATLDNNMASLRQRYLTQFSAMETLVASLKNTEKSLDNMMESWKGMMNS